MRFASTFVASTIITGGCHFRMSFARFSGGTTSSSMSDTFGTDPAATRTRVPGIHAGSGSVGPSGRGTRGGVALEIPGFHPGLCSVGPSGRGTRGGVALRNPRVSPWAVFRRPFRPRHEGRRCLEIPGFHPGLCSVGPSGRGTRGRAALGGAARVHQDPRVSPWAVFRRPFRPRQDRPSCAGLCGVGRPGSQGFIPGFHPGLGSVAPSGRGKTGRAALGCAAWVDQDPIVIRHINV